MTERDLSVFFIPPRILWVDAIRGGVFPLWNPYYYSGIPLLAALQPGVFYPPNILLLILPFDLAFNWIIIIHFFLSGVFTFLLLRELGASIVGALIGALIFMLGGYMISVHNLLSTLLSVTWVPLAIFLYLRIIKRNSLVYVVSLGIILAIMFTGGGIEVVYGTLGLLLFLALLPETLLSLSPENTLLSCPNVSIGHPSLNTGFPPKPLTETFRGRPCGNDKAVGEGRLSPNDFIGDVPSRWETTRVSPTSSSSQRGEDKGEGGIFSSLFMSRRLTASESGDSSKE